MPDTNADLRMRATWALIATLTALRVAGLVISPVELHGDEAQYWSWSRTFDFGYFSKPPLIAWVVAATTAAFGQSEWAVRLAAPFAHAIAALFLMSLARRRWGSRAAMWTGVLYITMPAIWLSSAVISTDALLLALWSGALWALDRHLERPSLARALALGAFIGVGFLAKYAMIYFVLGLAVLAVAHAPSRAALARLETLAAAAVVAVCLAPNIFWNAGHEFATVSHTAANASWGAASFRIDELGKFLGDQFAVFGPVGFALLLWAFWSAARAGPDERARYLPLIAFVAPALVIVAVQAFISRANANWAAAAYAAGTVFVVGWALDHRRARWLAAAAVVHAGAGAVFAAAGLFPAFADRVCLPNAECLGGAFKRARGWETTLARVTDVFVRGDEGAPYTAVVVDNRLLFHALEYYGRDDPLPLRMWLRYAAPVSHAEAIAPVEPTADAPVLVVSEREADLAKIMHDFADVAPAGETVIELGGGEIRRLRFLAARGYAPLPRGPEYEARWRVQAERSPDAESDAASR